MPPNMFHFQFKCANVKSVTRRPLTVEQIEILHLVSFVHLFLRMENALHSSSANRLPIRRHGSIKKLFRADGYDRTKFNDFRRLKKYCDITLISNDGGTRYVVVG